MSSNIMAKSAIVTFDKIKAQIYPLSNLSGKPDDRAQILYQVLKDEVAWHDSGLRILG